MSTEPPSQGGPITETTSLRRFLRLTGRALRLRCPRCGGRGIFKTWFRLKTACPHCALVFDRGEEDYWIGGYTVNFVAAELLGIGTAVVFVIVKWPDVPWTLVEYGTATLMVILPIAFFPFSRTLWLAWDLAFRPTETGDAARR